MAQLRIIRSNPAIADDELARALMAGTDLDEDEANAIVRIVHGAPTEIHSDGDGHMLQRMAAVLEANGFQVAFDA
jgi:hypothetical protein